MNLQILNGDCRDILPTLPENSVHCCVTSPPYFRLRDYGVAGQIGMERTPEEYVTALVDVFRDVRRALRDDGTLWLNLGDSYNAAGRKGHGTIGGYLQETNRASATGADNCRPSVEWLKPKDLIGIPWMVAFALRADGWYLRSDIIWAKPNPMPESVIDRPTKSHEYLFLLTKSERYYYDHEAIREPHAEVSLARAKRNRFGGKYQGADTKEHGRIKAGANYGPDGDPDKICHPSGRNKRSVWTTPTAPYPGAHFAVFPPKLIEPCILAGCPEAGTVLDCFGGSGTTGRVAIENRRKAVLIELNPEYVVLQRARTSGVQIRIF